MLELGIELLHNRGVGLCAVRLLGRAGSYHHP
jgi:hypothetical protein